MERRQLTIMFTDLVNSTGLADGMDPEDFRMLIEGHRTIAVAPIRRYGGVVTRYLGDGMLVFFGYPEAHEDDPERAVRAGLEIVEATEAMNARWVGEGRGRIAVRIGIHTGIVVVGDVIKADVQERMAVFGNVPSIAARLQALARANSVVISGETKALLPPAIQAETRGSTILKGLARPVEIYTALAVREGGDRRAARQILPFVNREKELATVRQSWAAVRQGEGRCLVIEGDPGIGKSRLIRAIRERIITSPSRWLTTRTSPYAANTDFFALSEFFRQLLGLKAPAPDDSKAAFGDLQRSLAGQGLDDSDIALGLAGLLGIPIPDDAAATPLQPERLRELTLKAITAWLHHLCSQQPVILVIEDVHWADASTLEAIERLKTDITAHPLFLLLTTRGAARTPLTGVPADAGGAGWDLLERADKPERPDVIQAGAETTADDARPFEFAKPSPARAAGTGTLRLERLRPAFAADLLGHVLRGSTLPKAAVATLLQRANGVPLYLEELPKPVLEAGPSTDGASLSLPATLRDSLMAQLDRMGEAKAVAQTAAVLGHSFQRPLLEHVWEGDAGILEKGLAILTEAALIMPDNDAPTLTYGFRHALLAEIAYDSLVRDDRRRIHGKTAAMLAKHFQPLSETRPEILARHHEAAGDVSEAFDCWLKAGKAAARRSANAEAIQHFVDAEKALGRSHAGDVAHKSMRNLALQLARGPVLISTLGWAAPEVEATYRTALRLSKRLDLDDREKFRIWGGLFNVYLLRGDLKNAQKTMKRSHGIAIGADDPELLISSHRSLGLCAVLAAEYDKALEHMMAAESLIIAFPLQERRQTEIYGTNPRVIVFSIKAWCFWFKGDREKAEDWRSQAIGVATDASHPFSLCYALCLGASLAQFQGDPAKAVKLAEQALKISEDHAFPYWRGWAKMIRGWSIGHLGEPDTGLSELQDGLTEYQATGAAQMRGYGLSLLADAYFHSGQSSEAKKIAKTAMTEFERTGVIFYREKALQILQETEAL